MIDILPPQRDEYRCSVIEIHGIGFHQKVHQDLVVTDIDADLRENLFRVFINTLVNRLLCDQIVYIFHPGTCFFQNRFIGGMVQDILVNGSGLFEFRLIFQKDSLVKGFFRLFVHVNPHCIAYYMWQIVKPFIMHQRVAVSVHPGHQLNDG